MNYGPLLSKGIFRCSVNFDNPQKLLSNFKIRETINTHHKVTQFQRINPWFMVRLSLIFALSSWITLDPEICDGVYLLQRVGFRELGLGQSRLLCEAWANFSCHGFYFGLQMSIWAVVHTRHSRMKTIIIN